MGEIISVAGLTYVAVEVAKRSGVPNRYAPLASIVLGVMIAILFGYADRMPNSNVADWIVYGIIAGASASGIYSGSKAVAQ